MKVFLIIAVTMFCVGGIVMEAQAEAGGKILVAFFSWSGNNKLIAGQIAKETGGDLFEIKTVTPYPEEYYECIDVAKQEQNVNARPALSGSVAVEEYDIIFLCFPNWWGTAPMGVFTFLESYKFSGKTIYPFVAHGGSSFGRSLGDIKKLCPDAVIGEGLSLKVHSRDKDNPTATSSIEEVSAWLRALGVSK